MSLAPGPLLVRVLEVPAVSVPSEGNSEYFFLPHVELQLPREIEARYREVLKSAESHLEINLPPEWSDLFVANQEVVSELSPKATERGLVVVGGLRKRSAFGTAVEMMTSALECEPSGPDA